MVHAPSLLQFLMVMLAAWLARQPSYKVNLSLR